MTNFERITQSPETLATILSVALNGVDYEDDDWDPYILGWLNSEVE